MTGMYKPFARLGIVFCVLMAIHSALVPARAQEDTTYTVEGVEVDVTAKNAVEARTKAVDEAQVKAYQKWLEINLGAEEAAKQPAPDPVRVGAMVQDFEVTKEQLSATRYKGVFTVRFRPSALRHMVPASTMAETPGDDNAYSAQPDSAYQNNTTVNTSRPAATLVLPYYQINGRNILWEGDNPLRAAWSRTPLPADGGIVLPIGDLADVAAVQEDQPLVVDPAALSKLLTRYQTGQAVIMIATPNAMKGVDVNLYSVQPGEKPHFIRMIQAMPEGSPDPAMIYARAVEISKPIIASSSRPSTVYPVPPASPPQPSSTPASAPAAMPVPSGPAQSYTGRIYFNSVQEWVKMKNTLDRLPGMHAVMIKTLSPRMAEVNMSFAGDPQLLSVAMGQAGMSVKPTTGAEQTYDVYNGNPY